MVVTFCLQSHLAKDYTALTSPHRTTSGTKTHPSMSRSRLAGVDKPDTTVLHPHGLRMSHPTNSRLVSCSLDVHHWQQDQPSNGSLTKEKLMRFVNDCLLTLFIYFLMKMTLETMVLVNFCNLKYCFR